jgi:hypothetical protein
MIGRQNSNENYETIWHNKMREYFEKKKNPNIKDLISEIFSGNISIVKNKN